MFKSLFIALIVAQAAFSQDPKLTALGTYRTGQYNLAAAEIVAHDPATQRLFVVNGADRTVDILDMSAPANLRRISQIAMPAEHGRAANSVAVRNGVVAVAVEADPKTAPGSCVFFDTSGRFLNAVRVGALPDMLTFTPDGRKVLVANEGEPSDDYLVDPEGSVTIIDISGGIAGLTQANVRTAGFSTFMRASLEGGVRVFGPRASVAQDLEPEYIAVSPDSRTAYVTLQEANAIATVDIESARVTRIAALGLKEHWRLGNELDASDRDGVRFRTQTVWGMFMPDAIATFTGPDNKLYLITANEGDSRDYPGYSEVARVSTLRLDPVAYPNAAEIQQLTDLGRLNVTSATGDIDGDGDFDALHVFGGRSITVWNANDITQTWDSHNQLEVLSYLNRPEAFNVSNTDNTLDSRSDDKGPEPEAVTVGTVRGVQYAFVGNERTGNIFIYDVTDPNAPRYVSQAWNRRVDVATNTPEAGDLGPEGVTFIREQDSPTGKPLLVVANEISGTTTVWQID